MALASAEETRALDLLKKADAALKRFSLFSSSTKYEDAVDCYLKAANNFKMAKKWQEAGDAYNKCAECHIKLKSTHEAATYFVHAADMYKRVDPAAAISHYRHAITMFCEIGRFNSAAKHAEMIGELYEGDANLEEAITYFQQAADYYAGEDATTREGKCKNKVAKHSASLSRYDVAYRNFEELGSKALESNLLKFNAKKHFLHAGFCLLARGDVVASKQGVERYIEMDYTFRDSREHKLLAALVDAYEGFDVDAFADELFSYDTVSKLDPWETSILLRVKNSIQEAGDDGPDMT